MPNSKEKLSRSRLRVLRMKQIASSYFHAKKMVESKQRAFSDSVVTEENIYERYVKRVNAVFDKLDEMDKTIVNNDFYYQDYQFWYAKYFSTSTYYRLRNRAIRTFLSLYNAESHKR